MNTVTDEEIARAFVPGICDKCGKPVTKGNSALLVQELALGQFAGFVSDRHLFPTDTCEDSPSRRRHLEESNWKRALKTARDAELVPTE